MHLCLDAPMNTYNITEFSKKIGLSVKTVQRWDRESLLKAKRTISGRRYYTDEDIELALGKSEGASDD